MDQTNLSELGLHESGRIEQIDDPVLEEKLKTIGCCIGDEVSIRHKALFGDPLIMKSDCGLYSIRKDEARHIKVLKINEELCEKKKISV